MHALFFSAKRLHHSILAKGRHLLRRIGLTPARFDMLFAIRQATECIPTTQRDLQGQLGVTAPTVSRMAKSLEELGFIRRWRAPRNKRTLMVALTAEGRRRLTIAMRAAIGSGAVDMLVDCAFTAKWYSEERFHILYGLADTLLFARRNLNDVATLRYYFHPDD